MDAGLNVFVPPTKNAHINVVYEKILALFPLSHVIHYHGDKKYPSLVGIGCKRAIGPFEQISFYSKDFNSGLSQLDYLYRVNLLGHFKICLLKSLICTVRQGHPR